jgi:hypothetical protein
MICQGRPTFFPTYTPSWNTSELAIEDNSKIFKSADSIIITCKKGEGRNKNEE